MNARQKDLLELVVQNPGRNTKEYCRIRKDFATYPSHLRDRLFRLEKRGVIRCVECVSRGVVERRWYPVSC